MRIFRKKKKSRYTSMRSSSADMLLPSFSQSVSDMGYSSAFVEAAVDPEGDERKRLKGKSYDYLLSEKRDAVFEAEAKSHICFAKAQLTDALGQIPLIEAKRKAELSAAYEKKRNIEEEIATYNKMLEEDENNAS